MTLQMLATVEALSTAIDAARKSPRALPNSGRGDSRRLGRNSTAPALLGQIRDRDGDGAAARPRHANVAIA